MTNAIPQQDQATLDNLNPDQPLMVDEDKRYKTFGNQNYSRQIKETFAKAGFYFLGEDCIKCYSCGGGLQNWDHNEDPWLQHVKWFPKCPYLLQTKGLKWVKRVHRRFPGLQSSTILPPSRQQVAADAVGFGSCLQSPTGDTTEPVSPSADHPEYQYPSAVDGKNKLFRSPSRISINSFEQINDDSDVDARNKAMASDSARYLTLEHCKCFPVKMKVDLAQAGFYVFPGTPPSSDQVYCFCCGGGLFQWSYTDDPWVCHVRFLGRCPHVVQCRGDIFIREIFAKYGKPNMTQ